MGRKRLPDGEALTEEVRTRVSGDVYEALRQSARERGLRLSDVLREAVYEKFGPAGVGSVDPERGEG